MGVALVGGNGAETTWVSGSPVMGDDSFSRLEVGEEMGVRRVPDSDQELLDGMEGDG